MKKLIKNLGSFFIYAFFAFLPFQIGGLLRADTLYSSGFFNPYLSFQFYISDLFLLVGILLLSISYVLGRRTTFRFGDRRLLFPLVLFSLVALLSVFLSVDYVNSLFYLLRICEFLLLYFLFLNRVILLDKVLKLMIFVLVFVSLIGISQYILQHSLGLTFIGEPVVSAEMLGAAKIAIFDSEVLRAYGTFPHPNIFAGYLVFGVLAALYLVKKAKGIKRSYLFLALGIFCLALILTFSRSAFLALFAALVLYYVISNIKISLKYILLSLALVVFFVLLLDLSSVLSTRIFVGDTAGSLERSQFLDISKEMFVDKPFGVGIGNFTYVMQDYSSSKLLPWKFQPVHNMYLLVLNELGMQGLLVFAWFLVSLLLFLTQKLKDRGLSHFLLALYLGIFVIGVFDHYLFSIYQGQSLFWLFVGMTGSLDSRL